MRKLLSVFMAMAIAFACGCGNSQEQVNTDTQLEVGNAEEIVASEAYIQINGNKLNLNEATVKDFVDAGVTFGQEDIDNSEVLEWNVNANQLEILVYFDALELTINRADFGQEKATGDCIVGGVEVRLLNVDVLSTDINSLPAYDNIVFNEGIVFGDTAENALAAYGTPDRDFVADYGGGVSVRQLDFESNEGYKAYCQIKDGRIYCFIISA